MIRQANIMAIFPNIQLRYLLCCEYFLFMFLALLCKWMNPVISRDGVLYLLMARAWSEGGSYENMLTVYPEQQWIPAFPIFLVENLSSFGISYESAGVAISITLGSSLPLLVFSLSQEIQHDKRISLAASFLILTSSGIPCRISSRSLLNAPGPSWKILPLTHSANAYSGV